MNDLEQALEHDGEVKSSDKIVQLMKAIKEKQKSLIRIPFLEKIDLQSHVQENNELLMECRQSRDKIFNILKIW